MGNIIDFIKGIFKGNQKDPDLPGQAGAEKPKLPLNLTQDKTKGAAIMLGGGPDERRASSKKKAFFNYNHSCSRRIYTCEDDLEHTESTF